MRRVTAVVLLISIRAVPAIAQSADPVLLKRLEAVAASVTDGYAKYEGPSVVKQGRASTPLAGHVVALFSLSSWGGGNGSRQFLAVLQRNNSDIRFPDGRRPPPYSLLALVQTGEDFDRFFKDVQLTGDRITLTGGRWAKNDAHCCPSGTTTATYRFSAHGLNEVNGSDGLSR
jgi:hypothetical protein